MDSRRIVETLCEHDPVFAEFTSEILKADSTEDAWDLLYGPGGISKMSPDQESVHVPLPTHGVTGLVGRFIPEDKRRIKKRKIRIVVSDPYAPVSKGVLSPTAPKKALEAFKESLPGGRIRPAAVLTTGAVVGGGAYGAYKAKDAIGTKWRGYKTIKGERPAIDTRPNPVLPLNKAESGFEIVKADDDKRQVFGWASVIEKDGQPVLDKQGDIISADEMEKSAYRFVLESRKGGRQHRRTEDDQPLHVSDMIESMAMTRDKIEKMGLPPETPVGWWVGFKVNDEDTWRDVKNGKVTSFSIHGRGKRLPVE